MTPISIIEKFREAYISGFIHSKLQTCEASNLTEYQTEIIMTQAAEDSNIFFERWIDDQINQPLGNPEDN